MSVTNYFGDPKDKTDDTPFDGLKKNSLNAAGYSYLLGDAALFASGLMAGRGKEAATGLIWMVGGLAPARYANPNAEKQCRLLAERMGDYLRKEGVKIPDEPDIKELTRPNGVIENIESFLYKYPSQVLNTAYAVGGSQLLRSGIQHNKKWDLASGALVTAGALAGLLVSEKPVPNEKEKKSMGPFSRAVSWIQEKPLRISGALYTLNNGTLLMSAIKERQVNPTNSSYMFKFLTAATYIFGNSCLAMSSKDNHAQDDHAQKALHQLTNVAARIIAAQPAETQANLLRHVAGFIAAQPEMNVQAEEIYEMMQKKLQHVQHQMPQGNWTNRINTAPHSSPELGTP